MTKLCARGKSAAKRKFKVYPSAYANAYASKICAGKIKDPSGTKRKDWGPKKMNKGGGVDMSTIEVKKKKKPIPGDRDKRRKYMIDIQNPISEYDMKGKLIYTAAAKGKEIVKAYTGKAVRQSTETDREFEMRHEYHTPAKKTKKEEKAKGYIISDQRGMQMHYEPKPRYKEGGVINMTKMKYV